MADRLDRDHIHSARSGSAIDSQLDAIANSYSSLSSFLTETNTRLTQNAMVPLGKYGMIQGQLYNTNKVLVSMGDNWFVEMSVHDAQEVIQRRQSCKTLSIYVADAGQSDSRFVQLR